MHCGILINMHYHILFPTIVTGFAQNDTLETLLIGHNPFTAPYCYQLLDVVCENPNNKIKELDLDVSKISPLNYYCLK